MNKKCIIIMGVAGAGKSTIGKILSDRKDYKFLEGDDFHSKKNKEKMKAGIPLNDEDRYSWLKLIKNEISSKIVNCNVIVSCSALKQKYRQILSDNNIFFVYLKIEKTLASLRLKARKNHFMPDSLVESQFSILEEPNNSITLNETLKPDEIINKLMLIIKKNMLNYE